MACHSRFSLPVRHTFHMLLLRRCGTVRDLVQSLTFTSPAVSPIGIKTWVSCSPSCFITRYLAHWNPPSWSSINNFSRAGIRGVSWHMYRWARIMVCIISLIEQQYTSMTGPQRFCHHKHVVLLILGISRYGFPLSLTVLRYTSNGPQRCTYRCVYCRERSAICEGDNYGL